MKDTKIISVVESYTTHLRVSKDWSLARATNDDIRALLTNTWAEKGYDQKDEPLILTDLDTKEEIKFNKENI